MPETVTTINVAIDPDQLREAVRTVLEERDDRVAKAEAKHARATDQIRTMKLHVDHQRTVIEDADRRRTEERIREQHQIAELGHKLRIAETKLRKAAMGFHDFPSRLTSDDGVIYTLGKTADGKVFLQSDSSRSDMDRTWDNPRESLPLDRLITAGARGIFGI